MLVPDGNAVCVAAKQKRSGTFGNSIASFAIAFSPGPPWTALFAGLPAKVSRKWAMEAEGEISGSSRKWAVSLRYPPFRRVRQSRCGDDPVVLQKLWYARPVRTQLLIAIGAINLIAALLAGIISVLNTRTATRVEIEAFLEIAHRFVSATMKDLATQNRLGELQQVLPLELK